MAVLYGVTRALAAFYHDALDVNNEQHLETNAFRLLSKMPTVAVDVLQIFNSQPFFYPRNNLSYSANC